MNDEENDMFVSEDLVDRFPEVGEKFNLLMSACVVFKDKRTVVGELKYYKRQENFISVEVKVMLDTAIRELTTLEDTGARAVEAFSIEKGTDEIIASFSNGNVFEFSIEDINYDNFVAKLYLKIKFDVDDALTLLKD